MDIKLTKDSFREQARRLKTALETRGVQLKLSDALESLAVSLGHRNLATLDAAFKGESAQRVDPATLTGGSYWVMTWRYDVEAEDGVPALCPYGTTLEEVARGARDHRLREQLESRMVDIPEGLVFSEETVALETYNETWRIDKYGLPWSADESKVEQWVLDILGFRVPTTGVSVACHDRGDDGGVSAFVYLWLNDGDTAKVRELAWPAAPRELASEKVALERRTNILGCKPEGCEFITDGTTQEGDWFWNFRFTSWETLGKSCWGTPVDIWSLIVRPSDRCEGQGYREVATGHFQPGDRFLDFRSLTWEDVPAEKFGRPIDEVVLRPTTASKQR